MKIIILLSLLTICVGIANGQSMVESKKNGFKFNIIKPLLTSSGEITYERFITPGTSFVVGLGGNLRSDRSDFQLNSDVTLEFFNIDIGNYLFLTEVRRYINFNDSNPPHGFYIGGYARYNYIDYSSNINFDDGNTSVDFNMGIDLQAFNFGALLGYQINLYNWLIDFEFLGIGYSPNWVKFNASTDLSSEVLASLSDAFNENFGVGLNDTEINLSKSSEQLSFWKWNIRYAISLGYSF